MGNMQDLGSANFFGENKAKMITVSSAVEQDVYNGRASYKGMLFLSIQQRNQGGQGFSKDTKLTGKLESGEAGRLVIQCTQLVAGQGQGFQKAYQTDQTSFDMSISAGQGGFIIAISKNQMQQGCALSESEILEIAGYIQSKAVAIEVMVAQFESGASQFTGQPRGGQGGGYNNQQQGGGYQNQQQGHSNAPQAGYGQPQQQQQQPQQQQSYAPQQQQQQQPAPSYGGQTPTY